MRAVSKAVVLVVLAAGVLAGCSKRNPTSPTSPGGGIAGDFYSLMFQYIPLGAVLQGDPSGSTASRLATLDVNGVPQAIALMQASSRYVDAGTVRVWQTPPVAATIDTLGRQSVPVHGTQWYLYASAPNLPVLPPITFDVVAWHHFQVSGSGQFPAFEDSILSVSRVVVSAPVAGATVSRSSNLIFSWSAAGTDTSVHVYGFVRSNVDSSIAPGVGDARDPDGHATVDMMHSNLPAGSARLTVVRYRVAHRTIGSLAVDLASDAIEIRPLTLQ